jgi:hypothetical protein
MKTTRAAAATVLGLALLAMPIAAQQAQPEMSAEEKAAMEKYEKAATPGPQHADLAAMAGTWEVETTFWMAPGAPPEKSTGTAERRMILGGRVMMEEFRGSIQGQPFEGMGTHGFDNVSGEWWGTWMDNMGTGMMAMTGKCNGKSCDMSGSYNDPMTGSKKWMRMTAELGADRELHVMYDKGPDGKEIKTGELVYTRKK